MGAWVAVFFRQAKVNDIHLRATATNTHQEIIGLDIAVEKAAGMDILDATNELVGQEQDSFEGELAIAIIEQILQGGTQEVNDHSIIITFCAIPSNKGDADTSSESFIHFSLVFELRVFRLCVFQLNSHLFAGDDVCTQIDIAKRAGADFAAYSVLLTHS